MNTRWETITNPTAFISYSNVDHDEAVRLGQVLDECEARYDRMR